MPITAQPGEQVLELQTWADAEIRAMAACRAAASSMLASMANGVGCDPTQNMPGATTCRRFGLALYAERVENFQKVWNGNFRTFAAKLYDDGFVATGNVINDEVLSIGLTTDGKYGEKTAHAMVMLSLWDAGLPPKCACEMRAWVASSAGQAGLQWMGVPVVNLIESPAAPAPTPPSDGPIQPQQPQQPPPPVVHQFQDQPVAASMGRQTNTTVYWGIGILALLAAGGTWYYLKGRKGRR